MSKCPLCLNTESVYNALLADLRELSDLFGTWSDSASQHRVSLSAEVVCYRECADEVDRIIIKHTGKK